MGTLRPAHLFCHTYQRSIWGAIPSFRNTPPFDGPQRQRQKFGPSKKEAEAVLGKRLNEIREGKFFGKEKFREILVEDLVRDYLERFQGKKVVDEKKYMQIILESFDGKFVSDIDRRDVESFQAVRRSTLRKDGLPRANSTCNREVEAPRRILNKAIEWGMLERNPASRLKRLPEPQGRPRFLSLDEAKRLLEASSRHLRPIIVCALETGRYAHLTPEHTRKAVESQPDWEAGEKDGRKTVVK